MNVVVLDLRCNVSSSETMNDGRHNRWTVMDFIMLKDFIADKRNCNPMVFTQASGAMLKQELYHACMNRSHRDMTSNSDTGQ